MADETDKASRSGPGFFMPSVILVALAVYAYLTFKPKLETARPQVSTGRRTKPPIADGLDGEFSRLWEDPLAVARPTIQPPSDVDEDYRIERPRRIQQYFAALLDASAKDYRIEKLRRIQQYFAALVDVSAENDAEFMCMPVLIPGGPYADDEEQRMRICYAVLAALTSHGYRPSFRDRTSWVELPIEIDIQEMDTRKQINSVVPVNLFARDVLERRDDDPHDLGPWSKILVCWVDESQLGSRPLCVIAQIVEHLFGAVRHKSRIHLRILGPTDSDTLLTMAKDNANWFNAKVAKSEEADENVSVCDRADRRGFWNYNCNEDAAIFSGRATISPHILDEDNRVALQEFAGTPNNRAQLRLIRTIGTDFDLVKVLKNELQIRRAWPGTDEKDDSEKHSSKHIILITESDSLYGRAIENLFYEARLPRDNLHAFTYLRGIDGETHVESNDSDKEKNERQKVYPLPEGRAQLDYLRRLEEELGRLQRRLNLKGERVSAIGVVGTDLYDKLLVLRALRPRFHRAIFFTTDLDARLAHESEYQWTRNLLVATHFGLTLNPHSITGEGLQHRTPPFRDSYQTSLFFTTMLAMEDDHVTKIWRGHDVDFWPTGTETFPADPWNTRQFEQQPQRKFHGDSNGRQNSPERNARAHTHDSENAKGADAAKGNSYLQPLIYEISNSGPYQLTVPGAKRGRLAWIGDSQESRLQRSVSASVHPPGPRQVSKWSMLKRGAGLLLALLLLGVCLVVSLTALREVFFREFSRITWCVVLAIALLGVIIWAEHWNPDGEPFELLAGVSIWPTVLLRVFALLLTLIFIFAAIYDLETNRRRIAVEYFGLSARGHVQSWPDWKKELSRVFRRKKAGLWLWMKQCSKRVKEEVAIWNGLGEDGMTSPKKLFRQYTRRGQPAYRILRTMSISLCYFAFYGTLFLMLGFASMPGRTLLATAIGWTIATVAGFLMVFLVFFVIDATQLCKRFVRELGEGGPDWPRKGIDAFTLKRETVEPKKEVQELIKIRLIANRTHHVGNLIKYPFIVILITIIARHELFDNWTWPWVLVILLAIILGGAAFCSILLRKESANARKKILRRLSDSASAAAASGDAARIAQTQQMITEIHEIRDGAFRPLHEDPVLQAVAIPFGGVGGLVLIEQMLAYL